ncbi:hypothetical protein ABPG75_000391 [Micractinium tetrahymenae]
MAALARADAALGALVQARAFAALHPNTTTFATEVGAPANAAYSAAHPAEAADEEAGVALKAGLAKKLAKLARWIASLDAALQTEAAAASESACLHLEAATRVVCAGSVLAGYLRLPAETMQQLVRAASTLVSSGSLLLQAAAAQPAHLLDVQSSIFKSVGGSSRDPAAAAEQGTKLSHMLLAVGAAHLEAMAALAPKLAAEHLADEHVQLSVLLADAHAPRLAAHSDHPWEWCAFLMYKARPYLSASLMAELLNTGLLASLLQACQHWQPSGPPPEQAAAALQAWYRV